MQNLHFLPNKPDKPNFYKNMNISFLNILIIKLATCCSQMIWHAKSCLMGYIVPSFWSFLMAFVGTTIICWGLLLTWNLFNPQNLVLPHLYNTNPLVGLDALIMMILKDLKCYLWNVVMTSNLHFITMQNWNWNKKYLINCSS
jgi:hypothetical protein